MTEKEQPFPIQLRSDIEQREAEFAALLGPLAISHERFMRTALLYVTQNPKLWACSRSSALLSIMEAARAGLMVDNKEAALIPYGGQIQFMPMIQGIIRLMRRSETVTKVEAHVVREGDEFDFWYGLSPDLKHKPLVTDLEVLITHAYSVMWFTNADPTFEVMARDELDLVRSLAKAPNSPAYTNFPGEMDRKIVTKRMSKYADLSPEAQRAIAIDHELFGDPKMDSYVDGLSEDYRNFHVKSQTQAGISDLKDRMKAENGDSGETEAGDESKAEDTDDELERAEQFVKNNSDPEAAFKALASRLEFTKEQTAEVLESAGGDFGKAYNTLAEQHVPPEEVLR